MSREREQIALPLDWPQSRGESRLVVSEANQEALDHFRKWSMWPVKATLLTGPRRSGRSLLARTFAERVGGRVVDQADKVDEEELFHAWNAAADSGRPLENWNVSDELSSALDAMCQNIAQQISIATMSGKYVQPTLSVT